MTSFFSLSKVPSCTSAITSTCPIVGYAGDFTYIGHTREIAQVFLTRIVETHKYLRQHQEPVYVLWQLALWLLFSKPIATTRDATQRKLLIEHKWAAIPFVLELISNELTCYEWIKNKEVCALELI